MLTQQPALRTGDSVEVEKPEWLAQMEGILETLNEGVIVVDDCQHLIFTNSVFNEMTGFSQDGMIGQAATALLHARRGRDS